MIIGAGRKILIGGGSGFVGSFIVHQLKQSGYHPVILTRTINQSKTPQIEWSDLKRNGLPEDIYGVINFAGRNFADPMKRWTKDFKREVFESRVYTTKFLANLIENSSEKTRPQVFMSCSAVGFYPASATAEYDEYSAGGGNTSFFTNLCSNWEDAAQLPCSASVRKVTLRLGLVLGRNGGIVAKTFWPFYFCGGGPMGDGNQWFPWIHISDVARLVEFAISNDSVSGILNATAPNCVTNKDFAKAFGKALNRPAFLPMPKFAVKLFFGADRAELFLTGQKVVPKRTLQFGFDFLYPTIEAAAAEFGRVRWTDSEQSWAKTDSEQSWDQRTAPYLPQ